jgi:chitodextrinase
MKIFFTVRQFLKAISFALLLCSGLLTIAAGNAQTTIAQHVADPSYFYPGNTPSLWPQLSQTNPVTSIAVANVSNGPNNSIDTNYSSAIQQANNAGVKVLGYVDTGYFGAAPNSRQTRLGQTDVNSWTTQIEQDVNTWYSFYGADGLSGILFDDVQNVCGTNNQYVTLYTDILNYVKRTHPGAYVIANPGTVVPQCLQNIADTLLTFENSYDCYTNDAACPAGYSALSWNPVDPQKIFHAVYGVPSVSLANASALSKQRNAGYVLFTDAGLPNPYDVLPMYLQQEAADSLSGGTLDKTIPTAPDTLDTVNVSATSAILNWGASTDRNGSGVVGYDIYQNGVKVISVPASSNPQVTITGLLPLTTYTFTATARNAAGTVSPVSNTLQFETDVDDGDLSAPQQVQASQSNYTDILLKWNAAQTNEYPIAYYDVFLGGTKVLTVDATVTSADLIGLTPGTAYSLTVQARDTHGTPSAMSSTVNTSTKALPAGGAIQGVSVQLTSSTVTITATYLVPFGFHHVYIDADDNASTGYFFSWETPTLGADYFIENNTLYYHTGSTTSFTWSALATITPAVTGSAATGFTYTWTIPVSDFTNGVPLATTERYLIEGTGYNPEVYAPIVTVTQQ